MLGSIRVATSVIASRASEALERPAVGSYNRGDSRTDRRTDSDG